MTDIIWLDENESEPRKQNFAIRQLLERVPGIEDDVVDLQALPACFFAHKNNTDQTGIADSVVTQLTFGTESYDIGSHFASNAWTPPSGKVSLTACSYVYPESGTASVSALFINKNGTAISKFQSVGSIGGSLISTIEDSANGSDAYTVSVYLDVSSGTAASQGPAFVTYFTGHWISA